MLEIINWLMSGVAFVGTVFNSRRNKISQAIWMVTNLYMAWLNYYIGVPSIGTLYVAYFLLAVYGLFEWRRQERLESWSEPLLYNRFFKKK